MPTPPPYQPPPLPERRFAGLDFIKAAFCPLEFNALLLKDHAGFRELKCDPALGDLEVGTPLHYPRKFTYTDRQGHKKTAIQMVTAPFGLAPVDFDLFLGLYSYLKRLPELPADGRLHLTIDFLARLVKLPATCAKDYQRLRSRLFRFSFVKYTNSAFWNPIDKTYDIVNFGFFNLASLSRVTESRRPVILELDPSFLRIARSTSHLAFDYHLYRGLSPALRRFYLIANRDGWRQSAGSVFLADEFTVHQIGYADRPELARKRLQNLKALLAQAEQIGLIRPFAPWQGYLHPIAGGFHAGKLALRWTRGPLLRKKEAAGTGQSIPAADWENDALYAQVRQLTDQDGKPLAPAAYHKLLAAHGAKKVQTHVAIVLAQREHHPGSFKKSAVAALIDRVTKNHPEPDWYQVLKRAERLATFADTAPNQLSLDLYGELFQ